MDKTVTKRRNNVIKAHSHQSSRGGGGGGREEEEEEEGDGGKDTTTPGNNPVGRNETFDIYVNEAVVRINSQKGEQGSEITPRRVV